MDQVSLYEQQIRKNSKANKLATLNICGRDKYLIDYIKSIFVKPESGLSIAELSIGDGSLTRALASSFSSMKLTCVDISPSRITLARDGIDQISDSLSSEVEYLECNFDTQFDLLPSSEFDIVIAMDIMEHVFDVFNFVENCNRILKDRGVLFLRVPNIAYIKHRIRLLFGELPITASWFETKGEITAWRERHGWDGGHLHYFTMPILQELLVGAGFEVIQSGDPGTRFSAMRNFIPKLLYSNPLIIAKKK